MTDITLDRYLVLGTNAQRLAFTPDPAPAPGGGTWLLPIFIEYDTGDVFYWDNTGTPAWSGWSATGGLADGDYGDIVVSSGGTVISIDANAVVTSKIANGAVTLAKIANIADGTMLGNNTGGAAAPVALNASQTRSLLSLVPGTNIQAWDAELQAIAGLASSANTIPRFTGSGTASLVTLDIDDTLAADSDNRIATQKAVKTYIDGAVAASASGLSWKQAVRVATSSAGTLATSFENGDTVDGVTLATGNRILIKNQAAPADNGIYVVAASGAPTRATDANTGAELVNASMYVSEGTTNADTNWTCTTNATITLGSTGLTFVQSVSGGGGLLAVNNLSDVNNLAISRDNLSVYSKATIDALLAAITAGTLTAESVRDIVAATLVGTGGITITDDDPGDTITIDGGAAGGSGDESIIVACSDETTALTTGSAKVTFRMPYALTLSEVRASVTTAPTGAALIVDINEGGSTILSTKLSIDATEKTSATAASAAVISDTALAADAEITIDIDQIGSTVAGAGLKVMLIGQQP